MRAISMLVRNPILQLCGTIACVVLLPAISPLTAAGAPQRMNVLMIAIDDLRPEVGCCGATHMHTPSIDRLAKSGLVLDRAYCQQAVCSPSRTSLLTGMRPDTTHIYDLTTHFRKFLPNAITLPGYFKAQGYHTQGVGKIFHNHLDDPQSWSVPHWEPTDVFPLYAKRETLALVRAKRERMEAEGSYKPDRIIERDPQTGLPLKIQFRTLVYGPAWEDPDVDDDALPDGQTALRAIEVLHEVKDKPFFLAVGFARPHLPFVAPKKYFDLYPPAKIKVAANPNPPVDVPEPAMSDWGELRQYEGMPRTGPLPDGTARQLIRGYYAATTHVDTQIGRVLDELRRLGLRDKTIIVLWGDHGWHLGEHGIWCKHTNFEEATRSLLIVSAPGHKAVDVHSGALVEFVDIYPTLCDLCGLAVPGNLEGSSMAALLDDPKRAWKPAAFSQYPRGKLMGHSIRTNRYRYTEWAEPDKEPVGVELYDHETDPGENVNIALRPDSRTPVEDLRRQLHAGWRSVRPNQRAQ